MAQLEKIDPDEISETYLGSGKKLRFRVHGVELSRDKDSQRVLLERTASQIRSRLSSCFSIPETGEIDFDDSDHYLGEEEDNENKMGVPGGQEQAEGDRKDEYQDKDRKKQEENEQQENQYHDEPDYEYDSDDEELPSKLMHRLVVSPPFSFAMSPQNPSFMPNKSGDRSSTASTSFTMGTICVMSPISKAPIHVIVKDKLVLTQKDGPKSNRSTFRPYTLIASSTSENFGDRDDRYDKCYSSITPESGGKASLRSMAVAESKLLSSRSSSQGTLFSPRPGVKSSSKVLLGVSPQSVSPTARYGGAVFSPRPRTKSSPGSYFSTAGQTHGISGS